MKLSQDDLENLLDFISNKEQMDTIFKILDKIVIDMERRVISIDLEKEPLSRLATYKSRAYGARDLKNKLYDIIQRVRKPREVK
ncbi:MAG: hypothetical protein GTN36_05445 [Candidatus Aenigmarchaeota archaeon]|nr:hypothetical protein [Candidatus Aenigmarchaeota archaeon]